MLLSIDTSSRYGGVALSDADGRVVEARLWHSAANHTRQLMPAAAELLAARNLPASELDGVAVALGPGPFSALRVGVSAAKGLAMAGGLPIVGIDTLALEAMAHLRSDGVATAWLGAGRNEVAAGWFGGDGERVQEDAIASPEELLGRAGAESGPVIYCGEAANGRAEVIRGAGLDGASVASWTPAGRLWALAELAAARVRDGDCDDLSSLQPYYLRMPTIGTAKRRDRVRQGRTATRNQTGQN